MCNHPCYDDMQDEGVIECYAFDSTQPNNNCSHLKRGGLWATCESGRLHPAYQEKLINMEDADSLRQENKQLKQQNDYYRDILVLCYRYFMGTKPGPSLENISERLNTVMEEYGIIGSGTEK